MNPRRSPTQTTRRVSRRAFLAAGAVPVAAACAAPFLRAAHRSPIEGSIVGGNSALGHSLRDGKFPPPTTTAEAGFVIVGGGIAGLAAARQLRRNGVEDFLVLELDSRPGGNAVSGRNGVSAFPWGAHYVPITGPDTVAVTELFEELGVISGRDATGLPIYHEEYLCADPMERLFLHGRWQEGFVPQIGVAPVDRGIIAEFLAEMQRLKSARGADARRAFTIPLDESSRDEAFLRLDAITMVEYLRERGWDKCEPLRWYINYCCRDDYGAGIDHVSAWAGVHYFASRDGRAANAASDAVVTWPEGNGWLVSQIAAPLGDRIRSSCAVWNIEPDGDGVVVDYFDSSATRSTRLKCRGVIWAAPHFVARRVIRTWRESPKDSTSAIYSPWMVANLTLNSVPGGRGLETAWDNVIYGSRSLGYVVATHQNLRPVPGQTVITYYLPLDENDPSMSRTTAGNRTHGEWCDLILADLGQAHPDLANELTRLDVWIWGHAMVRPVPGFIWGGVRSRMQSPMPNVVLAHSDLSGISIFEEAYTRGVRAADSLLTAVGHRKGVV